MYISWQTVITVGSVIAALTAIITLYNKILRWVDHQSEQDRALEELKNTHNRDMAEWQKEQALIVYGLCSALKGLKEKGCNGPVTEAIHVLEKHLNLKAHNQKES